MLMFIHSLAQDQLDGKAVGTAAIPGKVGGLIEAIEMAVESFEFPTEGKYEGQGFIIIEGCNDRLLSGVAEIPSPLTEDVLKPRIHRGEAILTLDRTKVELPEVTGVAAIVYDAIGYEQDPETTPEEWEAFVEGGYTHALINVLAFAGPKDQVVGSGRFVRNLAGNNAAYDKMTAEELRELAAKVVERESTWMVVG